MTRFSEKLKQASEPNWSEAVGHRFVRELTTGTVADAVMARYLIQDHRFIDSFLTLLGAALTHSDIFEARITLGRFIGMISSDENDYFLRSFRALGLSEAERRDPPDSGPTGGLKRIMLEAARSGSYAATIAVLAVAEGIYLDWGQRSRPPYPRNFIHTEWITLHNNDYFAGFVAFLRSELDRVGPASAEVCRDYFIRTVKLEREFFDDAYTDQAQSVMDK